MKRQWPQVKCGAVPGLDLLWTILLAASVMLGCFLTACGGKQATSRDFDAGGEVEGALEARVKKNVKPQPDEQVAVIETDFGKIVIELYPNIAPNMVARFKQLINEGFYHGTTFHRINPQLGIIQGGDPLSKDDNPNNDGAGDSPYPNVPAEFSDLPYERGIVGAARKGPSPAFGGRAAVTEEQAWDTANAQFFITLKRVPDFDKRYTVFGRVIAGINNAEIIAGAPVEQGTERPADKIVIKSITLQPRTQ